MIFMAKTKAKMKVKPETKGSKARATEGGTKAPAHPAVPPTTLARNKRLGSAKL